MDSSPRKRCMLGRHLSIATHCPGLAAHLTEHVRCLYRPGLKDANTTLVSTSQAQIMGCSVLSISCLPHDFSNVGRRSIEAISMEAPIGNAKDAAEERRLCRKGDNAKVRAPRRRPSSWRRRKKADRGRVFGVVLLSKKILQTKIWGKPVKFPCALGLDIPFFPSFCCPNSSPTCIFGGPKDQSVCLILAGWGCSVAYCAKGSNRSNFPWIWLPKWPRWEIASYLYWGVRTGF